MRSEIHLSSLAVVVLVALGCSDQAQSGAPSDEAGKPDASSNGGKSAAPRGGASSQGGTKAVTPTGGGAEFGGAGSEEEPPAAAGAGGQTAGGQTAGGGGTSATDAGGAAAAAGAGSDDCSARQTLPVKAGEIKGLETSEDFVFDKAGRLLNFSNSTKALMAFRLGDASSTMLFPGENDGSSAPAGLAMLPNGDLVSSRISRLVRYTLEGASTEIASGLSYANGVTLSRSGHVYAAEQVAGKVVRVDPDTKEKVTIADGLDKPNGLGLSEDQLTLFVGSFGTSRSVYAIDLSQSPPASRVHAKEFGGPFDGIAVDRCGNVYVTQYASAIVWRIDPAGNAAMLADLGSDFDARWIPNLHFGSGVGGWDERTLYVMELKTSRVFSLPIGIRGTTQPHL